MSEFSFLQQWKQGSSDLYPKQSLFHGNSDITTEIYWLTFRVWCLIFFITTHFFKFWKRRKALNGWQGKGWSYFFIRSVGKKVTFFAMSWVVLNLFLPQDNGWTRSVCDFPFSCYNFNCRSERVGKLFQIVCIHNSVFFFSLLYLDREISSWNFSNGYLQFCFFSLWRLIILVLAHKLT